MISRLLDALPGPIVGKSSSDIIAVMETIAQIVETVAIAGAAIVGILGLNTWRREMVGRKKADLAEQTLANFYEAREVIRAAR